MFDKTKAACLGHGGFFKMFKNTCHKLSHSKLKCSNQRVKGIMEWLSGDAQRRSNYGKTRRGSGAQFTHMLIWSTIYTYADMTTQNSVNGA